MPEFIHEFDCCECGRHVVAFGGNMNGLRLCAACLMLPGWYTISEIARWIDPEHHRTVADDA